MVDIAGAGMKNAVAGILLVLGLGGTAAAADLSAPAPIEPPPPAAFSWTGLYFGGHVGYAWSDFASEPTDAYGGQKPDGWVGGGQAGFNYQFDNRLVLGIEADASFGSLKDDVAFAIGDPQDGLFELDYATKVSSFGTVRARAGYAFDRFLPYATGGLGWARAELDFSNTVSIDGVPVISNTASDKQTFTGWTIGAGLEYAITNNITAKAEYLYTDLGSKDFDLGTPISADLTLQTVKFGLNYKF
jgi:outer membrane immunogenic protein